MGKLYETQIDELNTFVKTKIAPSKIEGVGLFALRDIPKGQRLYANIVPTGYNLPYKEFKNLFPEVRDLILEEWPQIVNGSIFFYPTAKLQAYINHSDKPNYDAVNDIVLKNIKANEEIVYDYRTMRGFENIQKAKLFNFIK